MRAAKGAYELCSPQRPWQNGRKQRFRLEVVGLEDARASADLGEDHERLADALSHLKGLVNNVDLMTLVMQIIRLCQTRVRVRPLGCLEAPTKGARASMDAMTHLQVVASTTDCDPRDFPDEARATQSMDVSQVSGEPPRSWGAGVCLGTERHNQHG